MPSTRRHVRNLMLFVLAGIGSLQATAEPAEPADVVRAFNAAITERQVDAITGALAPDGVQFTLRTAHAGMTGAPTGMTGNIVSHWKMVAPLLFTVTSSYKRVPEILDARTDGELATVWARIDTDTVEKGGATRQESFSELYLLVLTKDGWKIGAIADNRGTDNLRVE